MADPHIAAIEWSLTPENWDDEIIIRSGLDGNVRNTGVERYDHLSNRHLDILENGDFAISQTERGIFLTVQTNQSHIRMAQAARLRIQREGREVERTNPNGEHDGFIAQDHAFRAIRGKPIQIEKMVSLYHSRDHAISDPLEAAKTAVSRAPDHFRNFSPGMKSSGPTYGAGPVWI